MDLNWCNRWKKLKLVSEVSLYVTDNQEQVNNLCESLQLATNINRNVNTSNKLIQVLSFQHISDEFNFSCDFDRRSNNVSTQA